MRVKIKHLLIAGLCPLVLFCLIQSIISSLKFTELNLIGLVMLMYFVIPVLLFTWIFTLLVERVEKLNQVFSNVLAHLVLSSMLCFLLVTLWILIHGSQRDFEDQNLWTYWMDALSSSLYLLVYFAVSIPITFWLLRK